MLRSQFPVFLVAAAILLLLMLTLTMVRRHVEGYVRLGAQNRVLRLELMRLRELPGDCEDDCLTADKHIAELAAQLQKCESGL